MPVVQKDKPAALKPYLTHGVDLNYREGDREGIADCPWCGKEQKWYVNAETGLWQCKVCGEQGNVYTFFNKLHEQSTTETDLEELATTRGLLSQESLKDWGVIRSILTGEILVPGYSPDNKLTQLYRYSKDWKTGRYALLVTPETNHGLHGVPLYDPKKPEVYVCEGFWDGAALWEILREVKEENGKLLSTSNPKISLLSQVNVLAVPGANVFNPVWSKLLEGKVVTLLYDSDHTREHNGKMVEGAGLAGMKRVAQILSRADSKPLEVRYLHWGEHGFDPQLPSGYDLRDHLKPHTTAVQRVQAFRSIQGKVQPIPSDWLSDVRASKPGSVEVDLLPCYSWKTLVNAWRKSGLKWIPGLDRFLAASLAAIASTESVGEQIWLRVLSPPSTGKTTICEALSTNRKYIYPKDTFTGLTSGYQLDKEGSENMSMVLKLKNKTLIINDGDTMRSLPNRDVVFAQLRAFYSRNLRSQYGNKMSMDHEGSNTTIILCGTEAMRFMDSSELGSRFLDVRIIDEIDEDLEDEIGWTVVCRAARESHYRSDGKLETRDSPEMVEAKRLTGGYIDYLREHALELVAKIDFPPEMLKRCQGLAKFVAYMRARPSKKQEEKEQREVCFRLACQLVRLAQFLAVVLNKEQVDTDVMERVTAIALDTSRGRTLELVRRLARFPQGLETGAAAASPDYSEDSEKKLLYFLRTIKALQYRHPPGTEEVVGHLKPKRRWYLAPRMRRLYESITKGE